MVLKKMSAENVFWVRMLEGAWEQQRRGWGMQSVTLGAENRYVAYIARQLKHFTTRMPCKR